MTFHGEILADSDISAASLLHGMLVIGADEAVGAKANENYIQLLKQDESGNYRTVSNILVYRGDKQSGQELDIEGFAVDGDRLYVIGSHSLARKRFKESGSYEENLKRLTQVKQENSRYQLFRLTMDATNQVTGRDRISLAAIFNNDPLLSRFTTIPGKENGIDIEGIAAKDGLLYLGFRGPVLRDGYVPVMQLAFEHPAESYKLLFVNLAGRGIRDMAAVSDGFLILAGPVGDEQVSYQLLHWNGQDCLTGNNHTGKLQLLTEITPPAGGKAEGVALLSETAQAYELLIVFDGARNGAPVRHTIKRPGLKQ
ncbi:MAG: hypothetical protein AUJ57_04855 [Zetaproteobacteria bacterium CG1_02_53_45]|nr:MAG: hypothetical protein AUJ57_04855 [Zetaproteobacteria bacterium CG1_02_53_45]